MTSHSAVVKRFGCCEALLLVTFLYAAHPCATPFGPAGFAVRRRSCGARAQAKKGDSPQGESFGLYRQRPKEPKATSLDDQPFGC
ncbi:hypothetical protein [[Pseudomonas] boreopolis]|uniref:hypothetical protein n=1 Tax=Xanthomonas boreopolis TaxID=86183 RepID=UPI003D9BE375